MGFPTNNAMTVGRLVHRSTASSVTGIAEAIGTGQHNLFSVPAVVDVSGMEFSMGIEADAGSGTPGLAAVTGDASALSVAFNDGGPTGNNATAGLLFAATVQLTTSTTTWTAQVPHDAAGTSTTDLDADDWVNFIVSAQPTSEVGAASMSTVVNYIYGKPGTIN
jgi:hypothetical protein